MRFVSTMNSRKQYSFRDAVLTGLAPDGGLYFPAKIPRFSKEFIRQMKMFSLEEISYRVAREFAGLEVPRGVLKKIVEEAINFPCPLQQVSDKIYVLELFHGPTLAFKDFGARFMARLISHFVHRSARAITILVATSGDTGSAVASGFHRIPGIRVIVLYPSGRISEVQEKQIATLGENITAVEVDGSFDDCQQLVKTAFLDVPLRDDVVLTSANSINIARLIPQSFYYFWAVTQLQKFDEFRNVVFSVPSGNFGNLTAGLIAGKMGLPAKGFVAATNANDVVPKYLAMGEFKPKASKRTISNAMDVGNPSNFARMQMMYPAPESMRKRIVGVICSESQTRTTIQDVYARHGYLLDPHGAVGYHGMSQYLGDREDLAGIVLETAHPAKFIDVYDEPLRSKIRMPERLKICLRLAKRSVKVHNDYGELRSIILKG